MTKGLERIWVRPKTKKKIKVLAANEGCTISDVLDRAFSEDPEKAPVQKKRGGRFDFPF